MDTITKGRLGYNLLEKELLKKGMRIIYSCIRKY